MGERIELNDVLGDLYKYSSTLSTILSQSKLLQVLLKTNECLNNMQRKKCDELISYRNMLDF